jgi:hypothetical protein
MQLQPVMSEAEQQIVAASSSNGTAGRHNGNKPLIGVAQPGANNVIGKSLFAWIQERRFAPGASVLLDQQNRMHPAIGELVSRVFYSSRVRTGPAAPRRGTGLPAFPSPVTWVDTRSLRGNVESRAGGTSLFNVAEARLVTSITRNVASQAPPNLTIGVITAYAEQRDLLRRLMGPHDWPAERQLEIDTVDAFEGREKDIIVLSLVRANRRRDIGFLRLEQRLNVAISRSRRLLIIVGDTSTLRQGYFHHLVATAQQVGQIIPAPKLIGMFLSRGRRRHEREERRREGVPEEAAGVPVATEDGVAIEGGVAPVAAPGQETHGPGGSRRRRRRAWERRRERLRALQEQEQQAGEDAGVEGEPPDASTKVDGVAPEAPSADRVAEPAADVPTGPVVRARRPRRRREPAPVEAAPVEADGVGEPADQVEPVVEVAPEPEPEIVKPRRTRKRAVPEAAPQPESEVAPVAEVVSAPKRRTRARPAVTVVAEVAEVVEVTEPKPARKPRARRPQPEAEPVVAEVLVEIVEAKPARRTRAKKAEATEALVVAEVVEAKPVRRTRAKKVEAVESDALNGSSTEPLPIPVDVTLPLPEPPDVEVTPARRTRARRASQAS